MDRKYGKLIAILYTVCMGILATSLALLFFYAIGLNGVLPIMPSMLLAICIAGTLGILFNKLLLKQKSKAVSFFLGVFFLLISLPFFDIAALFFIRDEFQGTSAFHATFLDYGKLYLMILIYSFLFIGTWLSLICGAASMLLNQIINPLYSQD
jgi:hypothetical protein